MLALSLAQPWATLVAEGRKRVVLTADTQAFQRLWRDEVAIHATDEWQEDAFEEIARFMRRDEFSRWLESPEVIYPMGAVVCVCREVMFSHYYDEACSRGACRDVTGRVGFTIKKLEKLDSPVAYEGQHAGLWEWNEQPLTTDKTGQVVLF